MSKPLAPTKAQTDALRALLAESEAPKTVVNRESLREQIEADRVAAREARAARVAEGPKETAAHWSKAGSDWFLICEDPAFIMGDILVARNGARYDSATAKVTADSDRDGNIIRRCFQYARKIG